MTFCEYNGHDHCFVGQNAGSKEGNKEEGGD